MTPLPDQIAPRCGIAKGVVIGANSAPAGVCHACGGGPEAHDYPVYSVGRTVNAAGAVAWLGMGMPASWAAYDEQRQSNA